MGFVSVASSALFNVHPEDTGAASAVLNTAQQIGGSFGTAIQNTIVVSSASAYIAMVAHPSSARRALVALHNAANVHGYDLAFRFGAAMLLLAAMHFFFLVNIDRHHLGQHDEVPLAL
jgi:Ca2+/Na+ antiporter